MCRYLPKVISKKLIFLASLRSLAGAGSVSQRYNVKVLVFRTSVPVPDPYVFGPPGSASRSISLRYGSEDPDPHLDLYQKVTDPSKHWFSSTGRPIIPWSPCSRRTCGTWGWIRLLSTGAAFRSHGARRAQSGRAGNPARTRTFHLHTHSSLAHSTLGRIYNISNWNR